MPLRPALYGAALAALLATLGAAWFLASGPEAEAAGESLPLPPEIPRIAEGPEYEACLALLRKDAEDARSYAESWELQGGGEGARHCAALAVLALGDTEVAAERLERLARASRAGAGARAAVYAQAVQAWMLVEKPGRAFAAATLGLTLSPDDVDLLTDRAVASAMLGRYGEALEDLETAARLNPDRTEVWVFRAAALRHLDRVDQAAAAVARALAINPESAEALLERGIIRQMQGDTAGARADWESAARLAPDTPTADLALQNLALNEAGPQRR